MNRYGMQAREHWRQFLPSRFARISDPDSFFSTLGQQVATEIDELVDQLQDVPPEDETYLERVGRLEQARRAAEERVLAERVLLPAEPGSPLDEDSDMATGASTGSTGWIPLVEDPASEWWAAQEPQPPR